MKSEICNVKSAIRPRIPRGFTLLEVLLTLLLAGVVLVIVGGAIRVTCRALDQGRADLEEGRLAQSLLRRMADDIRGAVQYDPMQVEKMVSQSVPSTSGTGSGAGTDASSGTGSGAGTDASSSASSDASKLAGEAGMDTKELEDLTGSRTTDLASSTVPASIPGLYGNKYELQVDVSRLPRLDQYESLLVPSGDALAVDRLSDVKTVAYYISPFSGGGNAATGGGLVRRELDRAVTSWAAQQGGLSDTSVELPPVAPEIVALEFRYFDGSQWLEEWDSVERGGLPVAVEIGIAFDPTTRNRSSSPLASPAASQQALTSDQLHVYRLLVHIPAARPGQATAGSTGSDQSADSTSADSSSSASSGSTPATGTGASGTGTGASAGTGGGASAKTGGGTGGTTSKPGPGTGTGPGTSPGSGSGPSADPSKRILSR